MVCRSPPKINSSKDEQNIHSISFEANLKHAWTMDIGLLLYGSMEQDHAIFRQCVTCHPNKLVHLRLCQHSQGDQVGSVGRMQLRPSDIVVSPDILRLFLWFPY